MLVLYLPYFHYLKRAHDVITGMGRHDSLSRTHKTEQKPTEAAVVAHPACNGTCFSTIDAFCSQKMQKAKKSNATQQQFMEDEIDTNDQPRWEVVAPFCRTRSMLLTKKKQSEAISERNETSVCGTTKQKQSKINRKKCKLCAHCVFPPAPNVCDAIAVGAANVGAGEKSPVGWCEAHNSPVSIPYNCCYLIQKPIISLFEEIHTTRLVGEL